MELKDFISRYDFGKPMRVQVYKYKPFRVAIEGYVVDGKLIDVYDDVVCDNVNALDDDYSIFDFGIDDRELLVRVSPKAEKP